MIYKAFIISALIVSSSVSNNFDSVDDLSFEKVINLSIDNDTWLLRNKYTQKSIELNSIAAGTYSDPKISINALNLPTDSFDLNQEAMTQLKIGVSQMFPRGNSLEIKQDQLILKASQYPFQREDRKSKLTVKIASLWLDAYKAQESIVLIEKNRNLFNQLADVAESSYSSALGKTRQQDIIRAQLELTRLDDKLTKLKQKQDASLLSLSEWIYSFSEDELTNESILKRDHLQLPNKLPNIDINSKYFLKKEVNPKELLLEFENHPAIKNLQQKIKYIAKGTLLSQERYKPQFGINTSYSKREDDLMGKNRSDLFSIGVSFDIPIFTENKQDKELEASILRTKAVKTEKVLLLRKLLSTFKTTKSNLLRLKERQYLYQNKLLPQIDEQAEAALTSYTNDDGDFAEVVRARISQLNSKIDLLSIKVDIQKLIIKYNYLFSSESTDILKFRKEQTL